MRGALTTKLPLPQFLPSARLAYLRLINRVREVIHAAVGQDYDLQQNSNSVAAHPRLFRPKYISWSASSAAQAEIIEYLEELIDLTKLLVGASEFRSGMLTRPSYVEYVKMCSYDVEVSEAINVSEKPRRKSAPGIPRRRRDREDPEKEVPASLRRIQSRKVDAGNRRHED